MISKGCVQTQPFCFTIIFATLRLKLKLLFMKKAILSALLLSLGVIAFAQEAEEDVPATRVQQPIERKHELGILTQSPGDAQGGVTLLGAQYKVWKDEHRAFRFLAGFGNHISYNSTIVGIGADSITEVHSSANVKMPVIGMGVEMHRNFWRNVYLSAAVDVWGGYGGGNIDTFASRRSLNSAGGPTNTYGTPLLEQDVTMTYVGLAPSIGGKIHGKRITFALELMPIQVVYRNVSYEKAPSSGILDFNAGLYFQRVSVSYRF